MQTSESSRRQLEGLPLIRQNVAGIDLGSERHWVCAPTLDGKGREIANFGAPTSELVRMAEWLKARQVESVAMESTGVYWIAPHEVLEGQGLQVLLVDTRQLARVPGRDKKTDPTDCEWIQRLHACGLLRGSFRPEEAVCMLRTLVRDKANLVAESGDWVRRMQKSLDQMNVRVHRAVSHIDGVTGMAILRAIAGGERDGQKLAKLRDPRCRKSEQEIAEQLSGHWREDHLFSLQQALKMYDAVQERIAAYEKEILRKLGEMERNELQGQTASPLPNALAPHVPTSGCKPVKKKKRNSASTRVAANLRMAALSLRHSQTALGAYYRKIAQRKGGDIAVFATARKLATLIFRLLRWGQSYVDEGADAYEDRYRQMRIGRLKATAQQLGYELAPINA